MLISDRKGRCARLATIILCIMRCDFTARTVRCKHELRFGVVQVHDLSSRRLLQNKLIVAKLAVKLQLHHAESDVIFFLRPLISICEGNSLRYTLCTPRSGRQ